MLGWERLRFRAPSGGVAGFSLFTGFSLLTEAHSHHTDNLATHIQGSS